MDNEVLEFDIGLEGGERECEDDEGDIEHPMAMAMAIEEDELADADRGRGTATSGAKSPETYDVAMGALQEATKRVVQVMQSEERILINNGKVRSHLQIDESHTNSRSGHEEGNLGQHMSEDDMDKSIRELMNELEFANRKCEIYRSNLLSVLKAVEDHKLELSIKVENIKISIKDGL
ncbi:hypothetical protein Ahy_B07g088968 [Arachis hypogaea]|uniref:Uncharacterized protein n=1 Tax=Arachis hypogaea TaxID=3818 RepID=A0A444YG30_ARAHY|nr:hypothetical protein Ahy_B07g088968 [Arachis hypogaea]